MNDLIPSVKITGSLTFHGQEIYAPGVDVTDLRRRIGMVFQKPNPFPMSIYDNVAYGPRTHGSALQAEPWTSWWRSPCVRPPSGTR